MVGVGWSHFAHRSACSTPMPIHRRSRGRGRISGLAGLGVCDTAWSRIILELRLYTVTPLLACHCELLTLALHGPESASFAICATCRTFRPPTSHRQSDLPIKHGLHALLIFKANAPPSRSPHRSSSRFARCPIEFKGFSFRLFVRKVKRLLNTGKWRSMEVSSSEVVVVVVVVVVAPVVLGAAEQ